MVNNGMDLLNGIMMVIHGGTPIAGWFVENYGHFYENG
jgi:hypothetical protein